MTNGTVRLAVLGCGHWGPNHIRNFQSMLDCKIATVADPSREAIARVERHFPGLKGITDYKKALKLPGVDAVVVSTPTSTHYKLVREALAAGKHVLCEKPLSETSAEAKELVKLAKSKKRVLMVGHVFLFNPGLLKVKEIV